MAYGIEELAEMKVTGPVQGGDMVAKPNEMPVGAAALLAKMQKKNTPGLFKLVSYANSNLINEKGLLGFIKITRRVLSVINDKIFSGSNFKSFSFVKS